MGAAALRVAFGAVVALVCVAMAAGALAYARPRVIAEVDVGALGSYAPGSVRHFRLSRGGAERVDDGALPHVCGVLGFAGYSGRARGFFVVARADGLVAFADKSTYRWGTGLVYRERPSWTAYRPYGVFTLRLLGRDGGEFVDPCGDGHFARDDGRVIWGPAFRPLDALPIRLSEGRVLVDVDPSRVQRREQHDAGRLQPAR